VAHLQQEFDYKMLTKWNKDLDTLLIFVSFMIGGGVLINSDQTDA